MMVEDDGYIIEKVTKHLFGTWRVQRDWASPLNIVGGEGAYLIDSRGRRYLDFSSQLVCVNLGYGNKRIIRAIKEQLDILAYLGPGYATRIRAEAAEALASILPERLNKFVFSSSGSEANEDAIKIARAYKYPSFKILARYWSYHGNTAGAISLTGDPRRSSVESHTSMDWVVRIPDPYCYRCPFGYEDCGECGLACLEYTEYILANEGHVAAIFLETITGTNGVIVPPDDFYPRLRRLADEYDVLLVFDEVMTGWGRTGKWFAFEHWGVEPDILTTAKGATSSYVPIGITAVDRDVASYFDDKFLPIGHTFAYHPLAMAAMKAAIQEYKEGGYIDNAAKVGEYLGKRLRELMDRHPCIGDVRGIGLFWGVELVRDRKTKEPFNTREDKVMGRPLMTQKVARKMLEYGVILPMAWISNFVIAPPLVATEEDIDLGVEALDKALTIADEEVRS